VTKTRWSDGMILASVRDGHGLTPQARERAFELAAAGLIDNEGLWKLTPAGAALADPPPLATPAPKLTPYTTQQARYAKGQHLVRPVNSDGTKGRAERLLCALNCRWTNRERGFVVSPSKLKRFEQFFADGWDACFFTKQLQKPEASS
jgi:hypothetical protein